MVSAAVWKMGCMEWEGRQGGHIGDYCPSLVRDGNAWEWTCMPTDPNLDFSMITMGKHQQAVLKLHVVKRQKQILPNKVQSNQHRSALFQAVLELRVSDKITAYTFPLRCPWIFSSLGIWWEDGLKLTGLGLGQLKLKGSLAVVEKTRVSPASPSS